MTLLEKYKNYLKETNMFGRAIQMAYWDMQTVAPVGGKENIGEFVAYFQSKYFEMATADEFFDIVSELAKPENLEGLDEGLKYSILHDKEDLEKMRRVPADMYDRYVRAMNNSSMLWPTAKQKNDWASYAKPLEQTIEAVKEYTATEQPDKQVYDALIDKFERGMTQDTIDRVFGELKEELVPLVNAIVAKPEPDDSKFKRTIPKHQQEELCRFLLNYMGYDFEHGTLAESEHPFTDAFGYKDARITNHFYENDVMSAIFSVIHEGGHALFEQHINPDYEGTSAASVSMMGLHESQSRFYENILGRNINFWKPIYADVQRIIPAFEDVTLEEFYREINHVKNSLIRTEADEVTYCLHIILRYEMERAIFIEGVSIDELPKLWNHKMKEYLHIDVPTDTEGILQDMHWSDGSFGYFPSYLLGSIYDGLLLEALEKDLGSVDEILAAGKILDITNWLKEKIHVYGATRSSDEVLEAVCGQPLTAKPLIKYFKDKYTEIYNL